MIEVSKFSEEVSKLLGEYDKDVTEIIKNNVDDFAKELVDETKKTAPVGKRHKHYRSNIAQKITEENFRKRERTWYVKGKDYRLTHLLEHGHETRGKRAPAFHFISKSFNRLEIKYINLIKGEIEKLK